MALLGALAAGALVAGYLPTRSLGGEAAVTAMILGCSLSLLGSIVGSLPLLATSGRPAAAGPAPFLASLGLRFFVVAAGAAALVLAGLVSPRPFLIWVAISYAIFLVADVLYSLREQRPA